MSAGEQPSVIEQEQARQVLRGVKPDVGQTLDVRSQGLRSRCIYLARHSS
ncbi:hypothetical protein [Rhodococcus sp. MS16]|nr:hypothetical protein [Rhodococcus sp. MS16]